MRAINQELKEHLMGDVLTIAYCWRIQLTNGSIIGFTNCDQDLEIDGVIYQSKSGFFTDNINYHNSTSADNMQIYGMLDSDLLTAEDLLAGKYDGAKITVFLVNYRNLDQGSMIIHSGNLGSVVLNGAKFHAEIIGLSSKLEYNIGDLYSPLCRAQFCDKECKLNASNFTRIGKVSAIVSRQVFIDDKLQASDNYYRYGTIKFITGNNIDRVFEVKESRQGIITLFISTTYDINVGDQYTITLGCDKTLNTCAELFGNQINFRGEPHIPGLDILLQNSEDIN